MGSHGGPCCGRPGNQEGGDHQPRPADRAQQPVRVPPAEKGGPAQPAETVQDTPAPAAGRAHRAAPGTGSGRTGTQRNTVRRRPAAAPAGRTRIPARQTRKPVHGIHVTPAANCAATRIEPCLLLVLIAVVAGALAQRTRRAGLRPPRVPGPGGAAWALRRRDDHQPLRRGIIVPADPLAGLAARGLDGATSASRLAALAGVVPGAWLASHVPEAPLEICIGSPAHPRACSLPSGSTAVHGGPAARPPMVALGFSSGLMNAAAGVGGPGHHRVRHCHPLGAEELRRHPAAVLHHHGAVLAAVQIPVLRRAPSGPGRLAVAGRSSPP